MYDKKIQMKAEDKYNFLKKYSLNGATCVESFVLICLLIPRSQMTDTFLYVCVGFILAISFLLSFFSYDLIIKIYHLVTIELISYFIVYTLALMIINSEIYWEINNFGICMLSILLSFIILMITISITALEKYYIDVASMMLLGALLILLLGLSVAIDLYRVLNYKWIYLVTIVIVVLSVISIIYWGINSKLVNIKQKVIYYINNRLSIVGIISSFIFYAFCVLFIGGAIAEYIPAWYNVLINWIPILGISLPLAFVLILYYRNFKNVRSVNLDGLVFFCYIIFWIIVPIVLFIGYLQRKNIGNFSTFKTLLWIFGGTDAIVLLAFNNGMQKIVLENKNSPKLIHRYNSDIIIEKIKFLLGNATILVTFFGKYFSSDKIIEKYISSASIFLKKSNDIFHYQAQDLNLDSQFKYVIFIFAFIFILSLLSYLLLKLEECLYVKVSFRKIHNF